MLLKPSSSIFAKLTALRGGAAPIKNVAALKDFTSDAAVYFGGIRTPATLLVGASLGALFAPGTTSELQSKSLPERLCVRLYNSCVLLSFMLSLCTIVTSTAAGVSILHGNFDPVAESGYMLLMREFEFEFITARLSYLSSLVSFIVGVTSRTLVEFNLLRSEQREEALVICFAMAALVTHLWSYINSTLYSDQSLVGMAIHLCKIVFQRAMLEHRPLQIFSLACSVISIAFLTKVLFFKKKGKAEDVIL